MVFKYIFCNCRRKKVEDRIGENINESGVITLFCQPAERLKNQRSFTEPAGGNEHNALAHFHIFH